MNTYDIGDQPCVTGLFTDVNGVPADPTTVVVKLRRPDGTTTTFTSPNASITNPSVGTWMFTVPVINMDGRWTVKFYGTAGVIAADEISFAVRCSRVDA